MIKDLFQQSYKFTWAILDLLPLDFYLCISVGNTSMTLNNSLVKLLQEAESLAYF